MRASGRRTSAFSRSSCMRHCRMMNPCSAGNVTVAYCIDGTVTFEDLEVLRADATPQPLDGFIAEGHRYWDALCSHDERLSVQAQRAAQDGTPSWRPYVRNAVTIGGPFRRPRD